MGKHTNIVFAPALVSLLLVMCFAIHVQCRIIDDMSNVKINLPGGLCAYRKDEPACKNDSDCYCCLIDSLCYYSMDSCDLACKDPPSSAAVTPTHPPLSSRHF
uniref:Uncharacterized protein n=1 Tax=Avena sativa TaxID=4498 RepID=A0ACD5VB13_AVESA